MSKFTYTGDELEIFRHATNWKKYYRSKVVNHFLPGTVLEVGAGIGEMTKCLRPLCENQEWIALDPDKANTDVIEKLVLEGELDKNVKTFNGFLDDLKKPKGSFSNLLFIDSLEHIKDDSKTLKKASSLLSDGGILIIIAPAHNFLFNEFDHKIGHFRRYSKKTLRNILPEDIREISNSYIDSAGFFLSLANKFILRSSEPSLNQILFWDRIIVPISIVLDKFLNYQFGKNLVFIGYKIK